jgi:hypothetical protein
MFQAMINYDFNRCRGGCSYCVAATGSIMTLKAAPRQVSPAPYARPKSERLVQMCNEINRILMT